MSSDSTPALAASSLYATPPTCRARRAPEHHFPVCPAEEPGPPTQAFHAQASTGCIQRQLADRGDPVRSPLSCFRRLANLEATFTLTIVTIPSSREPVLKVAARIDSKDGRARHCQCRGNHFNVRRLRSSGGNRTLPTHLAAPAGGGSASAVKYTLPELSTWSSPGHESLAGNTLGGRESSTSTTPEHYFKR